MLELGDIHRAINSPLPTSIEFPFTTKINGVLTSLAGSPSLRVYAGTNTTERTAGLTLTTDVDSIPGLHVAEIDFSDSFYADGQDFTVCLNAGTLGGRSVVGYPIAHFSINKRCPRVALSALPVLSGSSGIGWDTNNAAAQLGTELYNRWGYQGLVSASGSGFVTFSTLLAGTVDDEFTGWVIVYADYGNTAANWAVIDAWDVASQTAQLRDTMSWSNPPAGAQVILIPPAGARVKTDSAGNVTAGYMINRADFGLSSAAVDAIWDELQSGHAVAGSFGAYLNAAISGVSAPSAATVAAAVWNALRASHVGAGSFGEGVNVQTNNDKSGYALSSGGVAAIWNALTTSMTTASSIGKKLADWALGSDSRVLVSANTHTSGQTVAGVTAGVVVTTNNDKSGYELSSGGVTAVQAGLATGSALVAAQADLTTLLGRLTDTRAGKLDNLDATISSRSTISEAQVNTQVDTALADIGLDHLFAQAVVGGDVADNSFAARLVSKSATADFDTFNNQTDSLEALRDRGDAAWITATGFSTHSAADVWAVATRTLSGFGFTVDINSNADLLAVKAKTDNLPAAPAAQAGIDTLVARLTVGRAANLDNLDATVSSRLATTGYTAPDSAAVIAAAVWGASQAGYTTPGTFGYLVDAAVSSRLATGSYASPPSAATIADAVWDEALAGHTTAGSAGKAAADAATPGNVWSVDLSSGYGVGTAGYLVGQNLDASISSRLAGTSYAAPPSVNTIVAGVWNAARASYVTAGSFGQGVASVQGNVTGSVNTVASGVTVTTNSDKTGYELSSGGISAIWAAALSGLNTAGSIGLKLKNWVLGTDHKAVISADVHTAGVTIAGTTGDTKQTGDAYAVVASGTHGNAALNTDLDALLARLTSTRGANLDNLDATISSVATLATAAKKLLESDKVVDTNTTPWQLVYYERGTSTEIMRQDLYDVDGGAITDEGTVIGQTVAP